MQSTETPEPRERCGYCGRFMATRYEGWGIEPRCSQTVAHVLADPEHWSIDVPAELGFTDADGEPVAGHLGAHHLTSEQREQWAEHRRSGAQETAA